MNLRVHWFSLFGACLPWICVQLVLWFLGGFDVTFVCILFCNLEAQQMCCLFGHLCIFQHFCCFLFVHPRPQGTYSSPQLFLSPLPSPQTELHLLFRLRIWQGGRRILLCLLLPLHVCLPATCSCHNLLLLFVYFPLFDAKRKKSLDPRIDFPKVGLGWVGQNPLPLVLKNLCLWFWNLWRKRGIQVFIYLNNILMVAPKGSIWQKKHLAKTCERNHDFFHESSGRFYFGIGGF